MELLPSISPLDLLSLDVTEPRLMKVLTVLMGFTHSIFDPLLRAQSIVILLVSPLFILRPIPLLKYIRMEALSTIGRLCIVAVNHWS